MGFWTKTLKWPKKASFFKPEILFFETFEQMKCLPKLRVYMSTILTTTPETAVQLRGRCQTINNKGLKPLLILYSKYWSQKSKLELGPN